MQSHLRKADIDMQSDAMRVLTPIFCLVYSSGLIVIMAGMVYAVKLLLG